MKKTKHMWVLATAVACLCALLLLPGSACAEDASNNDSGDTGSELQLEFGSIAELSSKRIGVIPGNLAVNYLTSALPDAELLYIASYADGLIALKANKLDAFSVDEPILIYMLKDNPDVGYLDKDPLLEIQQACIFPKTERGEALCAQFNDFLAQLKADGALEDLDRKWLQGLGDEEMGDISTLPNINGILDIALQSSNPPAVYYANNKLVGFEMELLYLFCQQAGYAMNIMDGPWDAILSSVQAGKADIGIGSISVSEERKSKMLFSDVTFETRVVMAVRLAGAADASDNGSEGLISKITSGLHETFIEQNRWKLFLNGSLNTLIITACSIAFGSLLGFALNMLLKRGGKLAGGLYRACARLIQGMPTIVFLMIMFYLVFGKTNVNALLVAIVSFTLVFACVVNGLLQVGEASVDKGQLEAALSLGYRPGRSYFKIVLPQIMSHIFPAYQSAMIDLLKATAVLGYISVQDLTRAGDVVRGITFDAFFPLLFVALIYFLMEGLIVLCCKLAKYHLDLGQNKREHFLRGVKR